jgi:hypothetical protein
VKPARPAAYVDIESRPQRFDVLDADVAAIKDYIAVRAKTWASTSSQ